MVHAEPEGARRPRDPPWYVSDTPTTPIRPQRLPLNAADLGANSSARVRVSRRAYGVAVDLQPDCGMCWASARIGVRISVMGVRRAFCLMVHKVRTPQALLSATVRLREQVYRWQGDREMRRRTCSGAWSNEWQTRIHAPSSPGRFGTSFGTRASKVPNEYYALQCA